MRWEQVIKYGTLSDIGFRRQNNEDASIVQICSDPEIWRKYGHVLLVADGMGGHAAGELASKLAADTLPQTFYKARDKDVPSALKEAIEVTNKTINDRGTQNKDFQRMGTTCSSLVLGPDGATIGHVGDSRVYRIRGDRIDQLTFDHSLQWELLRENKVSRDEILLREPRHIITRSLGPEPVVKVDIEGPYPVLPDDVFVLCSDGLTGHLNDAEIGTIARELQPEEACRLLVNLANLRGGSDNITVVVVRVGAVPPEVLVGDEHQQRAMEQKRGWLWLAGFWAIAVLFVVGVILLLFRHQLEGIVSIAASASVLLVMMFFFLRRLRSPSISVDPAETVLWSPYATASARLTKKFLGHLAAVEAELQRTATAESWTIDWTRHENAYAQAKTAYSARDYSRSFAHYAQAVNSLMAGLHECRRQLHHEAKWGKPKNGG
jgi:protein phosphatase